MASIWNNLTFSSMTVIVFIRPPTLGFVSYLKVLITIFRVVFGFLYLPAQISLSVDFYRELTLLICSIKYFQPVLLLNLEMLSPPFFLSLVVSFFYGWTDGCMDRWRVGWTADRRKGRWGGRERTERRKRNSSWGCIYLTVSHTTPYRLHTVKLQY